MSTNFISKLFLDEQEFILALMQKLSTIHFSLLYIVFPTYQEAAPLPVSRTPRLYILLWMVVIFLLVALLLLSVVGLHCMKYKGTKYKNKENNFIK